MDTKTSAAEKTNQVVVMDVKMPFWSMVVFMVKLSIASIPAMIILTVIWLVVVAVISGIIGGIGVFSTP